MKGQSALEYVMTYGWLGIVLILALAMFYYIIKPNTLPSSKCELGVGLTCFSYKINAEDASLELVLNQGVKPLIMVEKLGCSRQDGARPLENLTNPVSIRQGEPMRISGGGSNNTVRCADRDGSLFIPDSGGDPVFYGTLCVQYREMDSGAERIACGSLASKFE